MHLGMSGSFRIDPPAAVGVEADEDRQAERDRHDHVVFHLSSGAIITFNDPRRFGFMDLLTPAQLARHPVLSRLGLEPLSPDFDAARAGASVQGKEDDAQGRAARSAGGRRSWQHLCGRGAACGRLVAATTSVDDCHASGRAAGSRRTSHCCHQEGAHRRDRADVDRELPVIEISRLRSRRGALSTGPLPRHHRAAYSDRTIHLLLSCVPALAARTPGGSRASSYLPGGAGNRVGIAPFDSTSRRAR